MGTAQARGQQGRQYDQDELEGRLRDALDLLMVDGATFRQLSVARIIEAAGVARSTFYTYYEDKAAMAISLGDHSLQRLYDSQRDWLTLGPALSREDITAAMHALVEAFSRDQVVLAAVTESAAYDMRVRDVYQGRVHGYGRAMARVIAQRAGDRAGRRLDPIATGEALAWMVERTVTLNVPGAGPARREATAQALADVICRTLLG